MRISVCFAALAALALAACAQQPQQAPAAQAVITTADPAATVVETVAEGLEFPWSLAFLPDGAMLVTEKAGRLRLIRNGQLVPEPISGVPAVFHEGQGGLLEVALHPRFAENNQIYLTYAAGTTAANRTTLARATLNGTALTNLQVLFEASPAKEGGAHFGGRLQFLPDDTLLLTLGDGFAYRERAQDLSADLGKIVRLTLDGAVPPDNPFVNRPGARGEIYSYGHRNVQGIARDPVSGRIYAHEHGPRGGDEVNLLQAGHNYGWPVITYGVDYSGAQISPFTAREGMDQPLVYWVPSIAPAGMIFYTGDLFPAWKGDLLVSALVGQQVRRVDLDANGALQGQEILLSDRETRFRDIRQGPDGAIYLLEDSPDAHVLRLRPPA
jgi:glucose/arabinose dehydrogenase